MPRRTRLLALAVLILWAVITYASGWNKSAAVDEIPHLGAGLAVLHYGDFRMNPEHPPLVKVLAVLPVYLFAQPDMTVIYPNRGILSSWADSLQNEFGYQLLFRRDQPTMVMLRLARVVPVLFAILGIIAVYLWGRALTCSYEGGLLAAAQLMLYPEFAGHGRLLTLDVPTLSMCGILSFAGYWWLKSPGWRRGLGFAALAALGSQVKLPVTVFIVFLLMTMAVGRLMDSVPLRRRMTSVLLLGLAVGVAVFLASWAASGFRFSYNTPDLPAPDAPPVYVPLPGATAQGGLRSQAVQWATDRHLLPQAALAIINHSGSFQGRIMYLNGKLSRTGWTSYFLFSILYKTSIVTLTALLAACIYGIWRLVRARGHRLHAAAPVLVLLVPFLLLFLLYMISRPNIGHRQVLFVYFPLMVLLGAALHAWQQRGRYGRLLVGGLLGAQVLSFAITFPHYETYFNELIRSPYKGKNLLRDSNIDWSTDLPLAAEAAREMGFPAFNYAAFGANRPESYGLTNYRWILASYPHTLYMPNGQRPDPTLPSLISMHTLPDARQLYPHLYSRKPDLLLNSFALFLPAAPSGPRY